MSADLTKNFLRNQRLGRVAQKKLKEEKEKTVKEKIDELGNQEITAANFRVAADIGVQKYKELNMIVDFMFWAHIVGLYESKILVLETMVEELKKRVPDNA